MVQGKGVDCKIFWEQIFASFLEWNFGLEFAESGEIWRIRQITAEILGFAKFSRPPDKLNSTAISENLILRSCSKMTLGSKGGCGLIAGGKEDFTELPCSN